MRHIYRIFAFFLLSLCICLVSTGCGKGKDRDDDSEDDRSAESGIITLYYLNKNENGLKEVPYRLEHRNNTKAAVNEILHRLSDTRDSNTDQYKASIYDGMIISSISLKKKILTIDFESNYLQLATDKEILLRASVVKSILQLKGVNSVLFTVGGDSLVGSDDKSIGAMKEDTFLLGREDLYSQKEKVTLFYANEKGDRLVEVQKEIEVTDNMPLEMGMLNALISESGPEGTRNPLPRDLVINRTQVYNNICYVDLGSQIEEIMPDVEDKIKIYAMVNTLVDRGYASQVQFTVDGNPMENLNDISHFDEPMSCDYSLAKKKKPKKKK